MLQEDGSFRQMNADDGDDEDKEQEKVKRSPSSSSSKRMTGRRINSGDKDEDSIVIPDKLLYHEDAKAKEDAIGGTNWDGTAKTIKGKWDYVDGKLILAADRSKTSLTSEDTLLVGRVVATTAGKTLDDDEAPVTLLEGSESDEDADPSSSSVTASSPSASPTGATSIKDTHLSVPKGKVNVGKFMYPKTHPSFFEQPMFQPTRKGTFQLQQILGSLNTQTSTGDDDEQVEKFKVSQFHNKRFLLTAHPLPEYKPKGETRWSIKYNKFVEDPPRKAKKNNNKGDNNNDDDRPTTAIRVMQVKFFANNTFATEAGLGSAAILRGKYDIIGKERDQLWMQVWRFGFGRSVSGSTYSEGKALSKDDEKCYWGTISFADEENKKNDDDESNGSSGGSATLEDKYVQPSPTNDVDDVDNNQQNEASQRLFVKGSILFGFGLEPLPVGRFILKELEDTEEDDDVDDDEDDDEEATLEKLYQEQTKNDDDSSTDDDVDWSNSFQ